MLLINIKVKPFKNKFNVRKLFKCSKYIIETKLFNTFASQCLVFEERN